MTNKKTDNKAGKKATKKSKVAFSVSAPVGRPTDYRPEYNEKVYKLCLLGATDKQMADILGVSEQTFNAWKSKHPEFLESLKAGKEEADAVIAQSLYHRAKGYSHPEDKIFNDNGKEMIVPTIKHYPPDTTACIFWLKNRQRDQWRDRVEQELTGKNGESLALMVNFVHAGDKNGDSSR